MRINVVSTSYANYRNDFPVKSTAASGYPETASSDTPNNSGKITDQQQQPEIQALKDRDQEVKAHEQAHLAAAAGIAMGGAHFSYTTGPDGQRYATGGEVSIDVSEVSGNPRATLLKAETIRRAALAPARPSGQDYRVAAKAAAMANQAAIDLARSGSPDANRGSGIDIRA